MEDKQERLARQAKAHRQWLKEMKLDVAKSYRMKVLHDCWYKRADFKEEVTLIS